MPASCALLGGFAIGVRVALLRQHNANAQCQRVRACTRSVPSLTRHRASTSMYSLTFCVRVMVMSP